jgi:hypothetical protein
MMEVLQTRDAAVDGTGTRWAQLRGDEERLMTWGGNGEGNPPRPTNIWFDLSTDRGVIPSVPNHYCLLLF